MLEQYRDMLVRCSLCHDICVFACPVLNATKMQTVAPSRKAQIVDLLDKGFLPPSQDVVETLYQCTGCRLCKTWCVYNDVDVVAYLRAARAYVVEASRDAEVIFPPYVKKIEENARQFGSPYDFREKQGADEQAIGALNRMASEKGNSILFFAGCTTRLFQPEIAVAALRILDALGLDYVFAPDREPCCGGPVADSGFTVLGREEAEATRDYIKASGCSLVLTGCPRCAYSLTQACEQLGLTLGAKVMHVGTYLEQQIREGKLVFRQRLERKVTIYDDPFTVRYLQLGSVLRNVVTALPGTDLVEMVPNKEQANPSTSYLGLPDPGDARAITAVRLEEARRTGAATILTSSPYCKRGLRSVAGEECDIVDIVEFVAAAILNG